MKKIVVIEDDKSLRKKLSDILKFNDFEVFSADNGKLGIKLVEEVFPDIILSDLMLPDISGFEILQKIKKNPDTQLIPFIFLTAKVEMASLREGMNLGADDYITKPFRTAELLQAIKIRIERNQMLRVPEKVKSTKKLEGEERLFLEQGKKLKSTIVNEIESIVAEGNYSILHTIEGKKFIVRKLIKEWEKELPEKDFVRIHRSYIINLNHIKKIEKWYNHTFRIWMINGDEPFTISRRYSFKFRKNIIK